MYTKLNLIEDLGSVTAFDNQESQHIQTTLLFLKNNENCFDRKTLRGHITGSAWLLSPDYKSVLLTHHAILDKWLQLGGHADGEADIKKVALREAQEETGITGITFVSTDIFDVDVHEIPENIHKQEPVHYHYDIRYLLQANTLSFSVSSESKALKWFPIENIFNKSLSVSLLRMARKWHRTGYWNEKYK